MPVPKLPTRAVTLADPISGDVACPGCVGIRAGVAGDLKLGFADGATDTFTAAAREHLDLQIHKVVASGTTASKLTLFFLL